MLVFNYIEDEWNSLTRHPELDSGSTTFCIMKRGFVYITTNGRGGSLYIGVTSDLVKRIYEHKNIIDPSCFTAKYNCKKLVYYEVLDEITQAIEREKQLKNWHRKWKIDLIESINPNWEDLYETIAQ